jgi:hypothetical protein
MLKLIGSLIRVHWRKIYRVKLIWSYKKTGKYDKQNQVWIQQLKTTKAGHDYINKRRDHKVHTLISGVNINFFKNGLDNAWIFALSLKIRLKIVIVSSTTSPRTLKDLKKFS